MQRRSRRVLRKQRGDGSRGPRTRSRSCMADLSFSRSKSPPSCPRASMRCGNEHSLLVRYVGAIFLQAAFGGFVARLAQSLSAPQSFTRVSLPHLRQSPQWSYGGELLEVIRFTSPTVGGAQPLIDGDEPALSWEQKFAREVASIEALPFVKGDPGVSVSEKKANLNKVYVSVWCCWEKSRKSFKQVCVACDEDLRPTHLEALRELRLKLIREHGHPEHVIDTRAAERRSAIEAEAALELGSQDGPPTACSASERAAVRERASAARNALDFMMAGSQLRSKREAAERARKVAGERELEANMALREAKMKQNEAVCAREAVAAALAHVQALQKEMGQLKRVRNGGASEASEGGADGVGGSHLSEDEPSESSDEGEGGEQCGSPPDWSTWTIKKWRKLESLAHKRRSVQIDSSLDNDRSAPPRGDERRSWRWHWRRGLVGTMQDWAEGRRHRVVHMLVEMARYFKVQNEVASGMGFGLTQEEVEALKVDKHIVDRLCEALAQLKQCRSEEERMDYHTVLAAVAPKREAQRDQGGKIRSFSERLRVARGARYVKGEMRLYVFDQAITQRAKFDEMAARGGFLII